jgi:hypothetical protein
MPEGNAGMLLMQVHAFAKESDIIWENEDTEWLWRVIEEWEDSENPNYSLVAIRAFEEIKRRKTLTESELISIITAYGCQKVKDLSCKDLLCSYPSTSTQYLCSIIKKTSSKEIAKDAWKELLKRDDSFEVAVLDTELYNLEIRGLLYKKDF